MKFALCAICRNERPYIEEWLAFHKLLGFDEICIYDNVSDDGTSELLETLDRLGEIRREVFPRRDGEIPQRAANADFLKRHAHRFDYVLMIDLDEFLFLNGVSLRQLVEKAEAANPDFSAIAIPWLMFGSSGQEEFSPGIVIDRFRRCAANPAQVVKTLFKPSRVRGFKTHHAELASGVYLDNRLQPAEWQENSDIKLKERHRGYALIHHYYTKSRAEWNQRRAMGRVDRRLPVFRDLGEFERFVNQPAVSNEANAYLDAVRAEMERIRARVAAAPKIKTGVFKRLLKRILPR